MKKILLFVLVGTAYCGSAHAQGMIVNELSQGASGAKEFIELLVVGSSTQLTGTVDLRDWIIDDNSGAFRLGDNSAPGIAIGHFRFTQSDTFAAVPIGALIVIYNAADTSGNWDFIMTNTSNEQIAHIENGGMVYYIPGTSTLLRACSGTPNNTSGSYAYTNSTIPPLAANWTGEIGLANNGDAIQIRKPDSTFYHGFGFSTPTQANAFTTFPTFSEVSLPSFNAFTGVAAGKTIYLNCGSWYFSTSYGSGDATTDTATTAETPGQANNPDNALLIGKVQTGDIFYGMLNQDLPCSVILPVGLVSFVARVAGNTIVLDWTTASETNNAYFVVERSPDQKDWKETGRIMGKGNSKEENDYTLTDEEPYRGRSYYRLIQVDGDGKRQISAVTTVYLTDIDKQWPVYPNPVHAGSNLKIKAGNDGISTILIADMTGRTVYEDKQPHINEIVEVPFNNQSEGVYYVRLHIGNTITTIRIVKVP
ncbi:MAG: T9SS type A sorting domain-containing protein [Taibaiella sp.]|jgi:hypothetical protein